MIKFNKHNVTNGGIKARVWYSLDNRADGRSCVTIYSKDYTNALPNVFAGADAIYKNETDLMTDYFEKGRIVLFADHPLYAAARKCAEAIEAGKRWEVVTPNYTHQNATERQAVALAAKWGGVARPMVQA